MNISVTLIRRQIKDGQIYEYPTPKLLELSIGNNYILESRGSGSTITDTLAEAKYDLIETQVQVAALIDAAEDSAIKFADSSAVDSFARLRISEPLTLFDSKQIHDNKPLFWDDQEVSGSGTSSVYVANESADRMSVSATTAGKRVRQTRQYFNYQSGKSQLAILTFVFEDLESGTTKEVGYYNDENGIFLRADGSTMSVVMRSFVTGSVVDTVVEQDSWNVDKMDGTGASGVTLDFTKAQIFFVDFEWLGVGRIRYGFFHNGMPIYVHYQNFSNVANTVYMTTPNLPIRYSIENDGTGAASSMSHLCSTVISEGGQQDNGILRYASTEGVHVDANVVDTLYAVIGMRLKAANLDGVVKEVSMSILSETNDDFEWILVLNPTVAGTFTYSDEPNSVVQVARGALANTVTNGTFMNGGWGEGNTSMDNVLPNAINLGSAIDGTADTLVLCVRPLSINLDIQAGFTRRELS